MVVTRNTESTTTELPEPKTNLHVSAFVRQLCQIQVVILYPARPKCKCQFYLRRRT